MTKKEADNIIKFISEHVWHTYDNHGCWVVESRPLIAKIKRMTDK